MDEYSTENLKLARGFVFWLSVGGVLILTTVSPDLFKLRFEIKHILFSLIYGLMYLFVIHFLHIGITVITRINEILN